MENSELLPASDVDDILQSLHEQINGERDIMFKTTAQGNAEKNSLLDCLSHFNGKTFDSVQSHRIFELGSVVSWLTKHKSLEVKDKASNILIRLKDHCVTLMNVNFQQAEDLLNETNPEPNPGEQIFVPLIPNPNTLNPDPNLTPNMFLNPYPNQDPNLFLNPSPNQDPNVFLNPYPNQGSNLT